MATKEELTGNTPEVDLSDAGLDVTRDEVVDTGDGVQSKETTEEQDATATPPDFGGLPFKDVGSFVTGHKSLQNAYRETKTELYKLQEWQRQVEPLLRQFQQQSTTPTKKDDDVDIPKFLETFITQGPKAIDGLVGKRIESELAAMREKMIAPLQAELARFQGEKEIDKFLASNPHLDDSDEEALLDTVRSVPWIRTLQGSVGDKLEAALALLTKKEPTRWDSRKGPERAAAAKSLASMKESASTIGAKGGKTAKPAKDEFDEVLDLDKSSRAMWK